MMGALDLNMIEYLRSLGDEENPEFFQNLVEMYLQRTPELIGRLREQAAGGRREELEQTAHRLKGSSLNIGAVWVAETCAEIERMGHEGQEEGLADLLERLERQFAEARSELEELVAQG